MLSLPYIASGNRIGGAYRMAQRSGEIAATPAALAHLARFRWAPTDTSMLAVIHTIRVGVTVSAAITTATEMAFRAIVARSFSVDFTTNMTSVNMASANNGMTGAMRTTVMRPSQLGTAGPGICTTAALSGQTMTVDNGPVGMVTMTNPSTTLGAAAVTNQVGAGVPMATLYQRNNLDEHPLILQAQEGVVIQPVLAGNATGTYALYVEWSWSEVYTF